MSTIMALLTLGFKRLYERAAEWLKSGRWDSLHLDMPEDFEPFLKSYLEGDVEEETLWSDYAILTGLSPPFIEIYRRRMTPIFRRLKRRGKMSGVYCYQDLSFHIKVAKITEKTVLLEYRHRVTGEVDVEAWRRLLNEELEASMRGWDGSMRKIDEDARNHRINVLIYNGYVKPLKEKLKKMGHNVEVIILKKYYIRPPLEILKALAWRKGVENLTNEEIRHYIEEHRKYLDIVISSRDVDQAHEDWTRQFTRR